MKLEEFTKRLGFESEDEMFSMIANVDLSSPEKIIQFKCWQEEDGTKEGLLKLPVA